MTVENMQEKAFMIIAEVGTAKSKYIEAIQIAKEGDFDKAYKTIEEGAELAASAHKHHFDIVQVEAQGKELPFSVMFMHAEDQLLTTETIKIMAEEIIELHKKISQ